MSSNKNFTLLSKVKPFKNNWRVQVKMLHSWKQTPPYADETLEIVLVDETGCKIHGSCPRAHMFRTQRNLPIGEWRVIENFKVSKSGGKYKPCSHEYKITITDKTVFKGSDHHDESSFLSLADFSELSKWKLDDKLLIDILGQPYDLTEVRIIQVKNEERKRIQFRIRDNSGNDLACCLWGSYAEQLENHVQQSNLQNNVCLLRFAKINEFRDEIQITNAFDATILDLNPTMADAIDFKEKMKDDPLPLALTTKKQERREIISVADDWNDVGISLISELFGITEIIKTKIVCTVTAIDTNWAWYYIGCKRCSHIVSMLTGNGVRTDNPLFRCNKCRTNVSNVEPKFKLHLIVHDKSGTCNIMLLGSVAKTIIGSEAVELWDGSYEDVITTCSDGTDIFKVSEVWSGDIIQKIESHSEPVSQIEGGSSSLSSGGVLTLKGNTDENSECSTPLSKRKGNESDLPEEFTSTSKKICPTAIKLEKTKTD
ncbi:hypothetical protein N665_0030s0164 [Sinapis alba]|nr:hypothetical protein N665_0030s0164 [Sinapis alba]